MYILYSGLRIALSLDIQQSLTSFVYIPSPLMGENHINIDVSILVVIFREIFKVAKFE